MSPGFTGVEQVQFVSDGTIGNVDVVVDPGIQNYVDVTPAHFDVVHDGRPYLLSISIHVPSNAPLGGSSGGNIQLVHVRSPLPAPLAILITTDV